VVENEPEQADVLYLLDATKASFRETLLQSEELAAEVYSLRRQVISLSKLVEVRESERDSVKQAHKKRLREVKRLQRYNDKLEGWLDASEPKAKKKNKKDKKDNKVKKDKVNTFAIAASPVDADTD